MGTLSILNKVKAYYNKEGYSMSTNYKGRLLSTTGSTETAAYKSMKYLMSFVDFAEENKQRVF
ncbi:MAG: hypothetical protein L3J45_02490 [Flavobacteriaceae bacterium]|nr:hypothetical protein [Flavobacteriaceae bacterium]